MTQTEDEFQDEVHYAFVAITLRMGKRSFNQQKRALQTWLDTYVPEVEARGLAKDVILMRRNVARWLLNEAAEAKRPAPMPCPGVDRTRHAPPEPPMPVHGMPSDEEIAACGAP